MSLSTASAVAAAQSLAREHGLETEPVVLADRSNLVLHLAPHPLVARVAMATSVVRVGMEWLHREVELSRFLHARGAFVTRPNERVDPGPVERDGMIISLWELEDVRGACDPSLVGSRLAHAHRLLAELPEGVVPEWAGWIEARVVLERALTSPHLDADERRRLQDAWERGERVVESARARTASFQAVHGDAHLRNVIASARGPLWTDWEDAFLGPVEWDLACLTSRAVLFGEERDAIEAALSAYDAPYDPDLARDLGLVRNLQVIPWLAVFAERDPALVPRMHARVDRLPAQ